MEYEYHTHEFEPVYDRNSRILILGSFPSVRSREQQFYYGHPQNRFWKVLEAVTGHSFPGDPQGKKQQLLRLGIALWDVIESCEIKGSSDSSIRNVVPTDLNRIFREAQIRAVYGNGALAGKLFGRYQKKTTGRDMIVLPSTSPANAAWSLDRLIGAWMEAGSFL